MSIRTNESHGLFPSPTDIFLNVTSSEGGGGGLGNCNFKVGVQGLEETLNIERIRELNLWFII